MDIRSIIAPVIQDRESLEEFADALTDRAPEVERDVARLKKAPADLDAIADLFRAINNIKGDSALCKLDPSVALTHPIKTKMARFWRGEISSRARMARYQRVNRPMPTIKSVLAPKLLQLLMPLKRSC